MALTLTLIALAARFAADIFEPTYLETLTGRGSGPSFRPGSTRSAWTCCATWSRKSGA